MWIHKSIDDGYVVIRCKEICLLIDIASELLSCTCDLFVDVRKSLNH